MQTRSPPETLPCVAYLFATIHYGGLYLSGISVIGSFAFPDRFESISVKPKATIVKSW